MGCIELHVPLAFPIVCAQRPEPKNEAHLLLTDCHRPVKKRNTAIIKRINPQFAIDDDIEELPKVMEKAILIFTINFFTEPPHNRSTFPPSSYKT